jgi:MFS family permease
VPPYAAIGVWGGILLTILRAFQGIGVGGEWGGSVLLSMEWGARTGRRGFIASWPQFGVPVGLILANGILALIAAITGPGFPDWGWRVPFLLSIVLVGIGLYIRLGILESPVFAKLVAERNIARAPVSEVLQKNWREVLLACLIRTGQQAPFYIFTAYVLVYGTRVLNFDNQTVLTYVMIASLISLFTIPFWGHVSDRIGRRRLYMIGAVAMVIYSFIYFGLLDTRVPALVLLAIVLSLPVHDIQYGPQAAFIAEAFTPRVRYSGSSLGYHLASITSGGPAPLIAVALFGAYNSSLPIAIYMAICALISLASAAVMPDRGKSDIDTEVVTAVAATRPASA